jgi:hypothetical protein
MIYPLDEIFGGISAGSLDFPRFIEGLLEEGNFFLAYLNRYNTIQKEQSSRRVESATGQPNLI